MHFITKYVGSPMAARALDKPPFGPGFRLVPAGAASMEVWGTSINDPGRDYTEFRLLADDGRVLNTRIIEGY
jgi:hypothetical protein